MLLHTWMTYCLLWNIKDGNFQVQDGSSYAYVYCIRHEISTCFVYPDKQAYGVAMDDCDTSEKSGH